jgi:hypothetical protein
MRLYLKPGHYTLYSYILTNEISHCKQTQDQPHISHILESQNCTQWVMKHIPRSHHGLIFEKDYGRAIGQCGNKNYIKSFVETKIDPYKYFISNLLHGIVRHQPLELIQWFMSITQKQQDALPGFFSAEIIQKACRYRRPDVLTYGLSLTSPTNSSLILVIACQMSIDNNDISCLDVLRRDQLWDGTYAFRHAASCKKHYIFTWLHRTCPLKRYAFRHAASYNNQFIFTWLHKNCPLERYDNIILKYPYVNDWLKKLS